MQQEDYQSVLKQLSQVAYQQKKAEVLQQQQEQQQHKKIAQEETLFKEAMADVKPIKNHNYYHHPQDKSGIKVRQQETHTFSNNDYFFIGDQYEDSVPDSFSKNGRGNDDVKRLKAKYWPIVGYVDLHGYRQDEVQETLNEFIHYVQQRGVCGEIVHGSGLGSKKFQPVLKKMVRRWLIAHPAVLAYTEPTPHNDGSVLILLKQKKYHND